MGKKIDEARYQKLMDAIELNHRENIIIAQALMRLTKNGDTEHDNDVEYACREIKIQWDRAFWDIRYKGW